MKTGSLYRPVMNHPLTKLMLVLVATIVYAPIFVQLYKSLGYVSASFMLLPIALAGWLFGLSGGLLAALLHTLLSVALFHLVRGSGWRIVIELWPGYFVAVFTGLLTGWLSKLFKQVKEQSRIIESEREALKKEIAERKKYENELLRVSNLESIGRLTTGIAHEINNPLTSASLNLQTLKSKLQNSSMDKDVLQKFDIIKRNIDRAAIIAKELLKFCRQDELELAPLDIHGTIKDVLMLMEHKLDDITIRQDMPEVPLVSGDAVKLEQVFTNIIDNSVEAMPDGGDIFISALPVDDYIEVKITDTGGGIAKEHISKVFDPFFTTKKAGAGTGLGLAICYGIIRQHNGDMQIASDTGKGTTVIVKLPSMRGHEKDTHSR